ncbi:tyrosine-type recombinase/integrase [Halanaerobium sp. ST460_2HS_T2]|uniref:tyrosine-type recombinase/integrase n=1 Tax=Halanaerobium sp. ST460_2HS_T2 TaxID=2183914 RepID=UPI000DF2F621|nr:tyrosine-type recombinase/integrase [Halanaerobium sp. ST460_2HS_T2]RCW60962.1 integrase/recombinase XerD [Halanaerobium sp. ST460_2HS_T2]
MRQKKLPNVLSEEEQKRLLEQPNPRYVTGQRNHLLLKIFLDAGLRLSEATGLKWKNISLMTGQLKVVEGKGAKDRILWLAEENLELLKSWKQRQALEAKENLNYVFTAMSKGTLGNKLDNRYVQDMVKRYAKKAGISKNVSPHTCRHTFATDMLRKTKNIRMVQRALGHNQLNTTMIYTYIYDSELKVQMKNFREKNKEE